MFMLFVINSNAQIENVVVSPTVICTGNTFNISFNITNKGNSSSYFTANSEYKLEIGTVSGNTFTSGGIIASGLKYTAAPYPTANNSTLAISFDVTMPTTIAANPAYIIAVTSLNPTDDTKKGYSNTIGVVQTPVTTASNTGPYCDTGTINLFSTVIAGATYSWTGPNGFTSTLANPVIANANPAMSGAYNVTATLNGCTSFASTTNVVVTNNVTWTGATGTDWNVVSNWSCNFLPKSTSNVIIPSGLSNYPILNTGSIGFCNNITVQPNASLTILNNTLQINGLITSTNGIDLQGGTINFTGTAAQTIPANVFLNNQVKNLTINNPVSVTNLGVLNISGILLANTGIFNSGNAVTLISSATQTALIDGSGSGTITGNVTMQRFLDPAFGYKLFSSPFQAATVNNFAPVVDLNAAFETFYNYDENRQISPGIGATGYIPYVDPTGILGVFKGYAVNFGASNSAKMIEVTGTVNNGSQSINLTNNNRTYTQGFNLVGNPYPSPIDWNAISGWTKNNVDAALYFFTTSGTNQYTGVYTSAVNGAGGGSIIPSMQGFFVHVTDSPTGTYPVNAVLSATNAVRVNNFSNEFVKTQQEQKETLKISAKFDNSNLQDDLLFYFEQGATLEFDARLDALKLMNTDPSIPNLYCLTNTKQAISINAIPAVFENAETIIPLGISLATDNWISISLEDLPTSIADKYIYLIDLNENKVIDLTQKSIYRFYSKAGKNETRFQLRMSNTPMPIDTIVFNELFSLDSSNGTITVKMNLNLGDIGDIRVTTLTGQILDTLFVTNKDVVEITGIKSTGLYIVSFYSSKGVYSKKIIIKN